MKSGVVTTHRNLVSKPTLLDLYALWCEPEFKTASPSQQAGAGPTPKTNRGRKMETGRVSLAGHSYPGLGTRGGHAHRRSSGCSTQHCRAENTHTHQRRAWIKPQGKLTCGLIALKVYDAHPLKAGAAFIASKIYQGEVSIGISTFL